MGAIAWWGASIRKHLTSSNRKDWEKRNALLFEVQRFVNYVGNNGYLKMIQEKWLSWNDYKVVI